MHSHLLAAVSNAGELGNVCNWQQQTLPVLLTAPGKELAALLGEPLPADAEPSRKYAAGRHGSSCPRSARPSRRENR